MSVPGRIKACLGGIDEYGERRAASGVRVHLADEPVMRGPDLLEGSARGKPQHAVCLLGAHLSPGFGWLFVCRSPQSMAFEPGIEKRLALGITLIPDRLSKRAEIRRRKLRENLPGQGAAADHAVHSATVVVQAH